MRTAPANCIREQGKRFVQNLVATTSEDFTNAVWLKTNASVTSGVLDPFGSTRACTLTATAAVGNVRQSVGSSSSALIGGMWVRRRTGTGTILLATPNAGTVDITSQVTGSWQRMCSTVTPNTVGTAYCGIQVLTSGDAVDIAFAQLEDIQGNASQSPSEYQSKGVMAAPYQGWGADGCAFYVKLNGNTVSGNVVTEGTGAAITSPAVVAGMMREMASTNDALWGRNLTNAAWTPTNITAALDQTGVDSSPNAASSLTATAANGTILQSLTLASNVRVFSARVKRLVGVGGVDITIDGGTTWVSISGLINGSTYTRVFTSQTIANPIIGFRVQTSGDKIAVDYAGEEAGNNPTSDILTTTTTNTRNQDSLSETGVAAGYSLQGWAEMKVQQIIDGALSARYISTGGGVNSYPLGVSGGSGSATAISDATTATPSPNVAAILANVTVNGGSTWGGTTKLAAYNGNVGTAGAFVGDMQLGTTLFIGRTSGGANQNSFVIIKYQRGTIQMSSAQLATITT